MTPRFLTPSGTFEFSRWTLIVIWEFTLIATLVHRHMCTEQFHAVLLHFVILRHLHRYITDDCFCSMVVSLAHTRLDLVDYGDFVMVGLLAYQQRHPNSVLNATTCQVYQLRCYDWPHHGCPCNISLIASARTNPFQGGSHGVSRAAWPCPPYLNQLACITDLPGHHPLHSSSLQSLYVPPFRWSTVRWHSFPVAASILWNSLASDIQLSPSLSVFRQQLKTFVILPPYFTINFCFHHTRFCKLCNSLLFEPH